MAEPSIIVDRAKRGGEEASLPSPARTPLLEARSVSVRIGEQAVVDDVSLTVAAGEWVAIVGPSGSGKSSLLFTLSGLSRPSAGEIRLRDARFDHLRESKRADLRLREFGYVFQFGELLPELSLGENVALPLRLLGTSRKQAFAEAEKLLDRLGIAELTDRRPFEVSGGEAQRCALARAVVHRPRIIFADEPTGALDSRNGETVLDLLAELIVEQECAVVLVTHDEKVAARAQRVVTMLDGHLTGDDLEAR